MGSEERKKQLQSSLTSRNVYNKINKNKTFEKIESIEIQRQMMKLTQELIGEK